MFVKPQRPQVARSEPCLEYRLGCLVLLALDLELQLSLQLSVSSVAPLLGSQPSPKLQSRLDLVALDLELQLSLHYLQILAPLVLLSALQLNLQYRALSAFPVDLVLDLAPQLSLYHRLGLEISVVLRLNLQATNFLSGLDPSTGPSLFGASSKSTTNISGLGSTDAISPFAPDPPVSQSSPSKLTQANLPPNQLIPAPAFSPFHQATYSSARTESRSPASARSLALLHLCILASKASWKDLYNAAIRPYLKSLTLPCFAGSFKIISKTHVELIYTRTNSGSSLRRLSVDCISHSGAAGTNEFLDFAQTNREFLVDIWGQITLTGLGGLSAAKRFGGVMVEGKYDMAF